LFEASFETGLIGTGRLHDLFVNIEGMTPDEFKNGGENLAINFFYAKTCFSEILIASTPKGICYVAFADDKNNSFSVLQHHFPNADTIKKLIFYSCRL
jgi:AraC family transcriptional regulator of adaptative response/methylated-DNA-[protein]-cysteine methyltransferase